MDLPWLPSGTPSSDHDRRSGSRDSFFWEFGGLLGRNGPGTVPFLPELWALPLPSVAQLA